MADLCPFDISPLAQPKIVNTMPMFNLNYTNQDYQSLKIRLLELIKSNFGNEFNDFNESSLAMVLVECYSALADMLSFKIDQIANELFIDTVSELENAFRLVKLVGYKPLPPLPAKAMFAAKVNTSFSSDIILNTPIRVSLDNMGYDVVYELYPSDVNNNPIFDSKIVIPAGTMFTSAVVGLEGKTHSIERMSDGKPNQVVTLSYENVFYGSTKVMVDGFLWKEVEYFTEHSPKPEYMIEYDAYYKPSIIFGNNKAGLIPPSGVKIVVSFRAAGKNTSEIVSGAFTSQVSTELPGIAHSIIVHLSNYTKSEFGYPGDNLNEIKKKLPAYLRTQNRAVTGADYKFITDNFASPYNGAVGKSNIILRNHGCAANIIDILILAKTGDHRLVKANDNLKKELSTKLNEKKMLTDYVCIKDGEILLADIGIDIHLDPSFKRYQKEINNKIVERMEEFFDLANWEFGKSLREKDIIKHLADIKEIKQIDVTFVTTKSVEDGGNDNFVNAKYNEIIRPDNININFLYVSGE